MIKIIITTAIISLIPCVSWSAVQDLDEVMARKPRMSSATFYNGGGSSPYIWQPETLQYTDATTGHEVWRLTYKAASIDYIGKEHGLDSVWSADGARIGLKNVPYTRISPDVDAGYDWVVNTDGSKYKKAEVGGRLQNGAYGGFGWANTKRDTIYRFQSETSGGAYKGDQLWKYTIDSNNTVDSSSLVYDVNNSFQFENIKNGISGDDKYFIGTSGLQTCAGCPNQSIATTYWLFWIDLEGGTLSKSWGVARGCGPAADPYGDHTLAAEVGAHAGALWALGPSGDDIVIQYSTGGNFWQLVKNGHYADGGPMWEDWDGDSFGTYEDIKIISDGAGTPDNPYGNTYWGHPAFDKWGRMAIVGDYSDTYRGTRIVDRNNDWNFNTGWVANEGEYDNGHHNWAGWTDYVVANQVGGDLIYTNAYIDTTGAAEAVVDVERPNISVSYEALPRPVQSPDGTKIAFHTVLFYSDYDADADDDDAISTGIAVAYYPHPPEITSVTGSGTYTIRWDWRTDQAMSRGYTQRGWPDEATDDPPPPRETQKFRLWRSADGTTWVPVSTVDADIFERYDFATGDWTGNNYWTITDSPGAGTWYYAVTAVEWSGLESRVLSNVFSTAGSQTAAYPADPKADTGITSSYNKALKRHYNIYAEDGAAPTISQTNRVASIPVASGEEYVDWLGNTDGSTQYVVTAVDTQGNESGALSATATHQESPATVAGQYTLRWNDGRRYKVNVHKGD